LLSFVHSFIVAPLCAMGQTDSKQQVPCKHFINASDEVTQDSLEGFVLTSAVPVAMIDCFPTLKVVVRADWDKSKVAVISGGGSGHEPADVEWIGSGMLAAVAVGGTYREPTVDGILQAIAAVSGPSGCLLVVKNYLEGRLNFLRAQEIAEKEMGTKIRIVCVADDIVGLKQKDDKNRSSARCIAGVALVIKIACAAAAAGLDLDAVYAEATQAANEVVSLGVAYTRGTVPARVDDDPIPDDMIEIGVGVQGEPGWTRMAATATAKDIIDLMVARLEPFIPEDGPLALLLNNLGAVPRLEMAILAKEILQSSIGWRIELMFGPTRYYTAMGTNGFSLSFIPMDEGRKSRLRAPCSAPGWKLPVVPAREMKLFTRSKMKEESFDLDAPSDHPQVWKKLEEVCNAIADAENEIGIWSGKVGTGKLGTALVRFTKKIAEAHDKLPLAKPSGLFKVLANFCAEKSGTMFAMFKIIFSTAAIELQRQALKDKWELAVVVEVLRAGTKEAQSAAKIATHNRTFFDALIPALAVDTNLDVDEWFSDAARAARRGARATGNMTHTALSYVPLARRAGVLDAGAVAVATAFTALDTPDNVHFEKLPAEDSHFLADDSPEALEECAKKEMEKKYDMREESHRPKEHYEGPFRDIRVGKAQGTMADTEFVIRRISLEDMETQGLVPAHKKLIMERQRMVNWLFRPKPNIVQMHQIFHAPLSYYFVLEKLDGKSLGEILDTEELTHPKIMKMLREMLVAIHELHKCRLIHRDIKPESWVIDHKSEELKLVEVCGCLAHLSESIETDDGQKVFSGTKLNYMSPEAIMSNGGGRQAADMWSIGVLLHLMLSDDVPYHIPSQEEAAKVFEEQLDLTSGIWQQVPENAKEMVQQLLERNVRARVTCVDALKAFDVSIPEEDYSRFTRVRDGDKTKRVSLPMHSLSRDFGKVSRGLSKTTSGFARSASRSSSKQSSNDDKHMHAPVTGFITGTLYLIRHGQAIHNIAEKEAEKKVKRDLKKKGIDEESPQCAEAVKQEKHRVLHNEDFFDASLSAKGKNDAVNAKKELEGLYARGMPKPTVVLVSPLQRTLQTSTAIFPFHSNVQVCEELRERMTGLPCDTRSEAHRRIHNPEFQHMDFRQVAELDNNSGPDNRSPKNEEKKEEVMERAGNFLRSLPFIEFPDESSSLRQHSSMAIVGHKGWLRELEHGALGHPDTMEFENCEVRAYEVRWTPSGQVLAPAVMLYSSSSLCTLRLKNFPEEWTTAEALPNLRSQLKERLSQFGEIKKLEVEEEPCLMATAVFVDQLDAATATEKLNGLDLRSDEQKKERAVAFDCDRLFARIAYDLEAEEWA